MRRVEINEIIDFKEGYKSMYVPSIMHSYSTAIEYIRKWFKGKFPEDYWKDAESGQDRIYIDGKHSFDDFRTRTKTELLKRLKPNATISTSINMAFDRDKVDMFPFGTELFLRRNNTIEEAVYRDSINNIYIAPSFEMLEIQFNFKLRYETRAQQLDMYKWSKLNFKIGATSSEFIDMDCHIPYQLMVQLAKDSGFAVTNNRIIDIVGFLRFANAHCYCPILYKLRNINGRDEFFMRVRRAPVHMSIPEISNDDGDRDGQLMTNFGLEFAAIVRFPATKCFVYYSNNISQQITLKEEVGQSFCFATIRLNDDTPNVNSKGWEQLLTTEYEDEFVENASTKIDLSELLNNGSLGKVIKHNTRVLIASDVFLDIKFRNNGKDYKFKIDWNTMVAESLEVLPTKRTSIVIYCDTNYLNSMIVNLEEIENRGRP